MFDKAKLRGAARQIHRASRKPRLRRAEFKKALSLVFGKDYRRAMPYAGLSSLLDMPYRPEAPDPAGFRRARGGARQGADGSRRHQPRRRPPRAAGGARGRAHRPLQPRPQGGAARRMPGGRYRRRAAALALQPRCLDRGYRGVLRPASQAGVQPLSVGGDHSITYPILKALGQDRPVGLVHIDAHCDTMGEIDGSKFHHGGPFRQAVLAGVLDPERTIQIGIRGPAEAFWGVLLRIGDDGAAHRGCRPSSASPAVVEQGARGRRRRTDLRLVRCRRRSTRPSRPAPARRRPAA